MLIEKNKRAIAMLLMALFLIELIRTAWISDDAAITLRSVLNFLNGYGPTFNVGERVQAYTHPLWFFLISGLSLLVDNVFAATFLLSISVSLLAFWLLLARVASNANTALVAGVALLLSKAYLDFATSGLENPLSHLLILAAILPAARALEGDGSRQPALFFLACSCLYLNRPDLLVIMFPLAVLVALRHARSNPAMLVRAVLLGAVPVLLWTLFSTYYYGFPFPNTAYAKLGTGIAFDERVLQGARYLLHSVDRDPLTAGFIVAGVLIGLAGPALSVGLAVGIVLYVLYVLSIGGDFMEGRFLTAPMLVATALVSRSKLDRGASIVLGAGVLVLGLANLGTTLLSNSTYSNTVVNQNGIADERGFYYQRYGLLIAPRGTFTAPAWVAGERKVDVICGGLGYAGIYSGPGMHYIDNCALADPLLARLPAKYEPNWRIGHFTRQLPTDYLESVAVNKNFLSDPATHAYYESIRLITRGPLNDPQRLREIIRFNRSKVARPDWELYRHGRIPSSTRPIEVEAARLDRLIESGPWNAAGNVAFDRIVEVILPAPTTFGTLDLSVDCNDTYRVDSLTDAGWHELTRITPRTAGGMVRHVVDLGTQVAAARRIRITALSGDGMYSVGHLALK
jgi:arabinofuranosyltransferase